MPFQELICLICDSSVQGAKAIAELLKQNSSLRHLELNNNMIEYSVCRNLDPFLILFSYI